MSVVMLRGGDWVQIRDGSGLRFDGVEEDGM